MNDFMKRDCVDPKGERILICNLNSSPTAILRRGVRLRLARSPQSSSSEEFKFKIFVRHVGMNSAHHDFWGAAPRDQIIANTYF